jgi:hypothetical protein
MDGCGYSRGRDGCWSGLAKNPKIFWPRDLYLAEPYRRAYEESYTSPILVSPANGKEFSQSVLDICQSSGIQDISFIRLL